MKDVTLSSEDFHDYFDGIVMVFRRNGSIPPPHKWLLSFGLDAGNNAGGRLWNSVADRAEYIEEIAGLRAGFANAFDQLGASTLTVRDFGLVVEACPHCRHYPIAATATMCLFCGGDLFSSPPASRT